MREYYLLHSGAQLDDAIRKVKNGYILPSGEIPIDTNGTFDVSVFSTAKVNVPGIKYASGTVVLNSAVTGVQNFSYDSFYINVGFVPSMFIFKQPNYTASLITGLPDTQKNICVASQYRSAMLDGGTDFFDVTYISKDTGTVITSPGTYGFLPADDGTKMIFYGNSANLILPAGTWRWEAFK